MAYKEQFRAALEWHIKKIGRGEQARIAREAGISAPYLNRILSGENTGAEDKRIAIAASIGLTYEEFLDLGRWVLLGKDGSDWPGINRGSITADIESLRGSGKGKHAPHKKTPATTLATNRHMDDIASWINTQDDGEKVWAWVSMEMEGKFPEYKEYLKKRKGHCGTDAGCSDVSTG